MKYEPAGGFQYFCDLGWWIELFISLHLFLCFNSQDKSASEYISLSRTFIPKHYFKDSASSQTFEFLCFSCVESLAASSGSPGSRTSVSKIPGSRLDQNVCIGSLRWYSSLSLQSELSGSTWEILKCLSATSIITSFYFPHTLTTLYEPIQYLSASWYTRTNCPG